MEEYGSAESQQKQSSSMEPKQGVDDKVLAVKEESTVKDELMQAEERVTGAVSYKTYARYSEFAGRCVRWSTTRGLYLMLSQSVMDPSHHCSSCFGTRGIRSV
jgi:ATP-binding cassette subfamily C (CFTR/MRP) protein 1